jgi:hypothetical protein
MRHAVTTTRMLREAKAALEDEAGSRPVPRAKPQPRTQPTTSRLTTIARALAHRARALAARAT